MTTNMYINYIIIIGHSEYVHISMIMKERYYYSIPVCM